MRRKTSDLPEKTVNRIRMKQRLRTTLILALCCATPEAFQISSCSSTRLASWSSSTSLARKLADTNKGGDALLAEESSTRNVTVSVSSDPLFSDQADAAISASFGEVVRPKYLSSPSSSETNPLKPTTATNQDLFSSATSSMDEIQVAARLKRRNLVVAIASIAVAFLNYFWQFTHPISPVQLLFSMEEASAPVSVIGRNGKPTMVDFWAPWCENCKLMAPTLLQVEEEYKDKVNFVMINGDTREAWPLIEAFGVDAIPHLAMVSSDGDVETALIGPIPKQILEADLDVLISNAKREAEVTPQPIPYIMLDVFASNPEARRVHFDQ